MISKLKVEQKSEIFDVEIEYMELRMSSKLLTGCG